jgi:hypothetical protein
VRDARTDFRGMKKRALRDIDFAIEQIERSLEEVRRDRD